MQIKKRERKSICAVFSLGMSLVKWQKMGILDKEFEIFFAYLEDGFVDEIKLFSYDTKDTELLQTHFKSHKHASKITHIKPPQFARSFFGSIFYSIFFMFFVRHQLNDCVASYTNQSSGAWTALISKYCFGHKFVYRYGHALWRRHLVKKQYHRLLLSWPLQKILEITSDFTLAPTKRDYRQTCFKNKAAICPNYIQDSAIDRSLDREIWNNRQERGTVVGRLMPFKNVDNLMRACDEADLPLDIIGDGPQRKELENLAKTLHTNVVFHGRLENESVMSTLRTNKLFFLVSTFEGMPKALLEGMAAACVVIISPEDGCMEVIEHGTDGIVCAGFDHTSIKHAIDTYKNANQATLGFRAANKIAQHYSLSTVLNIHKAAYGLDPMELASEG